MTTPPAPVDEKRDLYQEAIEELLDAMYYLTREVARLEDMRDKLAGEGLIRMGRVSDTYSGGVTHS